MIIKYDAGENHSDYIWIDIKIGKRQWAIGASSKFSKAFITKNKSIRRAFNIKIF